MKVLVLGPYPSGLAPSQRFRFEQYLDLVQNVDFKQIGFWRKDEWPRIYEDGSIKYKVLRTIGGFWRRLLLLAQVSNYNKVFIHREATPIGPPWFEWAVAKVFRKPIIFDFDDAIWLPNSSKANERTAGKLKFHGKTAKICSWATTVVTGNKFLSEYARQYCEDVRIIPTTIDTKGHHNPDLYIRRGSKWIKKGEAVNGLSAPSYQLSADRLESDKLVTIGWTGTHSTLKQLTPLFPVLEEVYRTHPFRFLLIADVPPESMPDFVEFRKWKKKTEIEDLLEIDIGVMPLYNTEWEKGKCGFKALQYMALGIPTIVSKVGANLDIIGENEFGLIAEEMPLNNSVLWQKNIFNLLDDHSLRNGLGIKGKERILDKYSILSNKKSFVSLFWS
ncbi:glycosyltransferase [Cryomorphaceae bacterium 1068]|nr:glycosyltransferase [Cryomorphaceae bacterium 1068]